MSEDASATYRGFRNQALYVLYRLLTDKNASEQTYRPEGAEDLAVFDSEMHLVEAVQVKDYSCDLSLSHLKPKSVSGFFVRLNRRRDAYPKCITKIASFGQIGPELQGAINGDETHRKNVVSKLCNDASNISSTEAIEMLESLQGKIIHPIEKELLSSVMKSLENTNIEGAKETSVELLMYWIFDASEKQRDITRQGLLLQFNRISSYLASLRDSSSEWEVSISPIRDLDPTPEEIELWKKEYRRGVQARWEHIVVGADCERTKRLQEIHRKIKNSSCLIIRGASGQGKSSLGWRYMHDYCASGLRFHVKLIEGREHAFRIANALGGHVKRLNLKAVVYIDISPSDSGWSALVQELISAGLKVLIAIREEDFARANISTSDFNYSEVALDHVTKGEARLIFDELKNLTHITALDFEDAWSRFALDNGGPLLEFTYLVSEGESLSSRIHSQISRLQKKAGAAIDGLTETHLELLALTAVANETGARVSLHSLYQALNIPPLSAPLKVLEKEYLLRITDDDKITSVSALHALRSRAIADTLFSEDLNLWKYYANKVIPLIVEEDLESFLLSAFSRKSEFSNSILISLQSLELRSWTQAAGIARALVWLGISQYESKNQDTVLSALSKYGEGWIFICDSFIGMDTNAHQDMLSSMNKAIGSEIESIPLTPKNEILEPFKAWANEAPNPPVPKNAKDWAGSGDLAHLLEKSQTRGLLYSAIENLLPTPLPKELDIEGLAQFISGRSCIEGASFSKWHTSHRNEIIDQFIDETDSLYLSENGEEIKVHFSVPIADSVTVDMDDPNDWYAQTMKRIRLLRLLFPEQKVFSSQGIGLELFIDLLQHDPTTMHIKAESLPPERNIQLNVIFTNLVAYRHQRSNSWKEYSDVAMTFRESVSNSLRKLYRGYEKLISAAKVKPNTLKQIGSEIDALKETPKIPMFPQIAVDEWGYISEAKDNNKERDHITNPKTLKRFDAFKKSFNRFESDITTTTGQNLNLVILVLAKQHANYVESEKDLKDKRIFLHNLSQAWEALRTMQYEFRARFGHYYSENKLIELKRHEISNFRHYWLINFSILHDKPRHTSNIGQLLENQILQQKIQFLSKLKIEVNLALSGRGSAQIIEAPWFLDNTPHLRIICDYNNISELMEGDPSVVMAIRRATQVVEWRPLEWTPLAIEWPKIAIISLIHGRAVTAACATMTTGTIFSTNEEFEVKAHHIASAPIPLSDFIAGGFRTWDNPLIRSTTNLMGQVLAFSMTTMRFQNLARLIIDNKLEEEKAHSIFDKFSNELKTVLTVAQHAYNETDNIIGTMVSDKKSIWKEDLKKLCKSLLFEVDESAHISLTLDTFEAWIDSFEETYSDFQKLLIEILNVALSIERSQIQGSARPPRFTMQKTTIP